MATAQEASAIHSCETRNGSNPRPGATGQLAGDIGARFGGKSVILRQNGHFGRDIGPIFSFDGPSKLAQEGGLWQISARLVAPLGRPILHQHMLP